MGKITDLKRFEDLFKSVGINLKKTIIDKSYYKNRAGTVELSSYGADIDPEIDLTGYSGFEFSFDFDDNGKFVGMGSFE